MKRSRIFLGATTTLLAVAGIAAAKSHNFSPGIRYYCTSVPTALVNKACVPYGTAPVLQSPTGTFTAFWTIRPGQPTEIQYTLYTNRVSTDPVCKTTSPQSCGHILKYTNPE